MSVLAVATAVASLFGHLPAAAAVSWLGCMLWTIGATRWVGRLPWWASLIALPVPAAAAFAAWQAYRVAGWWGVGGCRDGIRARRSGSPATSLRHRRIVSDRRQPPASGGRGRVRAPGSLTGRSRALAVARLRPPLRAPHRAIEHDRGDRVLPGGGHRYFEPRVRDGPGVLHDVAFHRRGMERVLRRKRRVHSHAPFQQRTAPRLRHVQAVSVGPGATRGRASPHQSRPDQRRRIAGVDDERELRASIDDRLPPGGAGGDVPAREVADRRPDPICGSACALCSTGICCAARCWRSLFNSRWLRSAIRGPVASGGHGWA